MKRRFALLSLSLIFAALPFGRVRAQDQEAAANDPAPPAENDQPENPDPEPAPSEPPPDEAPRPEEAQAPGDAALPAMNQPGAGGGEEDSAAGKPMVSITVDGAADETPSKPTASISHGRRAAARKSARAKTGRAAKAKTAKAAVKTPEPVKKTLVPPPPAAPPPPPLPAVPLTPVAPWNP